MKCWRKAQLEAIQHIRTSNEMVEICDIITSKAKA